MSAYRQAFGAWGEQRAAEYLCQRGYRVLCRNFRTPYGEIDLIVQKQQVLAFVEVKTRAGQTFGAPRLAVDARKQRKLAAAALLYLQQMPDCLAYTLRFDVVECTKDRVTHLPDAFRCIEGF